MAYTREQEHQEFWMLTKGILQDASVDTDEAKVVYTWLTEHRREGEFAITIRKLEKYLQDGYIDRFESQGLIESIGSVLRELRKV